MVLQSWPALAAPMTPSLHRLLRTLVRNPDLPPDAPLRASLALPGRVVPVEIVGAGAGVWQLAADLDTWPTRPVVLTLRIGQVARVDFPVRLAAEADGLRATVEGAPLVLNRRVTRNGKLEEALNPAA